MGNRNRNGVSVMDPLPAPTFISLAAFCRDMAASGNGLVHRVVQPLREVAPASPFVDYPLRFA
jgi:hypothetical protein